MKRYTELLYWDKYSNYIHFDNENNKEYYDPEIPARALLSYGLWRKYGEMNCSNTIRCRNDDCGYRSELREGPILEEYFKAADYLDAVKNGETNNNGILKCFDNNGVPFSGGIYVCDTCQEFSRDNTIYFEENGSVSPYGTYRCDYVFPSGLPKCEKCGSEKRFIPNIRSSKVKCPKCGADLIVKSNKKRGFY